MAPYDPRDMWTIQHDRQRANPPFSLNGPAPPPKSPPYRPIWLIRLRHKARKTRDKLKEKIREHARRIRHLKLRRLQELNSRLKEDLDRPRVKVAEASISLINYCNQTRDYMVPSVWGQVDRKEDPYNPQAGTGSDGCCTVM